MCIVFGCRVDGVRVELPKVIREKQLCKKMLAWLEGRVECTSSSLRPVGSGSF